MLLLSKSRVIGLTSYMLGLFSVVWSYWLLAYFAFGFAYYTFRDPNTLRGRSWRVFLYEWTRRESGTYLLLYIGVAFVTGGLGYWLVRRERGDGAFTLGAAAARLSICGFVGAILDLALLGLMCGYRVYRWLI